MKQITALTLIAAMTFTGTAWAQDAADRRDKTAKGAVIGGVAGAIAGAVIGNKKRGNPKRGAVVGAVVGTATGAIVGAMMDKQERELRQIEGIDVARTGEDELRVTMRNEILFDFDSASLRSSSRNQLSDMADVFDRYGDTTIVVEGHTDSTGSESYNRDLSRRRASTVERYIEQMGVGSGRIQARGMGESQPKSSNGSASGRQQNRRVELYVRANA
ncbi:MAG: OmpA family protein [Thermoanaerobaculia bacterium]